MALSASFGDLNRSQARASFRATASWYDATISKYENSLDYASANREVNGTGDTFYFSRPSTAGSVTLGSNIVPGHSYWFYNTARVQSSGDSDIAAPVGAAVDFGSKNLDAPAGITYSSGNSVNAFFGPGGRPTSNTFEMSWMVPSNFTFLCFDGSVPRESSG